MSGEKIIPIVAASPAALNLGAVLLPVAVPVLAGIAVWGLSRWLSSRQERGRRQAQDAAGMRSQLRDIEVEANRRLQQQRQEFQKSVQVAESRQRETLQRETERLESLRRSGLAQQRSEYLRIAREQRQEYTQLIAEQERKFTALMETERQERARGQQILQQQLDQVVGEIEQERQRKEQLAQDLLSDVEAVWLGIERDYQHERFAPGRLAKLRQELDLARSNIQSGVGQAAIATAQRTYLELADLRLELEQKEQEWQLLYQNALTNAGILMKQVEANRQCEVKFEGYEAEGFQVDVDYWSQGNLSQYEQELRRLESQLKDGESTLTAEEVKGIGEQIVALEPRLEEIIEQARRAILGSQIRAEIADRVVEALTSQGYSLVNTEQDTGYEGNDQRASYMVKVKNIAGDEVVTVISPQQEFGVNSISINTFSPTFVDENATQQNARAVVEALEQEGIQSHGQIECKDEARKEYQDLIAAKQRQVIMSSPSRKDNFSSPSSGA